MAKLNKVEAFIKLGKACNGGFVSESIEMEKIIAYNLKKEISGGYYSSNIELTKDQKKIYQKDLFHE
jgi:hypothetical protein